MQNALGGMTKGPRPLIAAIAFYASQEDIKLKDIEREIAKRLPQDPNDELRKQLHRYMAEWDWEPDAPWAGETLPNTTSRRNRIYELLQLRKALGAILNDCMPPYVGPGNILLVEPTETADWYTFEFRKKNDFYWTRVRAYLEKVRLMPEDSLASIDAATTKIVERLADPAASTPRGTRGLIVGYVQSGKTTNFTGVIAKSIDAGYRLIIVLSGTTNLLRNQTQRRLDMDLVGVENILRGTKEENEIDHDYRADQDWPQRFISYGKLPSLLGSIDITRLTGQEDFRGRNTDLNPLEFQFEKKNKQLPLYNRENLDHAGARIIVVKKNPDRLKKLLRDLKHVGEAQCAEIPTLIIDDESDQASINTVNPAKITDAKTRTTTNKNIVELLKRLPRAQYLGYTATPFANVFIDTTDTEDLYPRDFIMSLDRPIGYMGAREFHDFGIQPAHTLTNEQAYVRAIPLSFNSNTAASKISSNDDGRLVEAIDAFVLTGALKKYREAKNSRSFKHHTMLVHQSTLQKDHEKSARHIRKLFEAAAYETPGKSTLRLAALLEDFRKVWKDRGEEHQLKFPKNFDALKPYLGAALSEIRRGDPVLMVNSADGGDVPDFDAKEGVWKIIVGGAKLSRGYTIEGLTISYFRRSAKLQDTLMQMGRWFGYRSGYQDLVRLYIGRSEPAGKGKTYDLYKAFEAMCRDEEDFREQLIQYSADPGMTPKDIPALVFNSHPDLRPTARNKMYFSRLTWAAFNYREPTNQSASSAGRKTNAELFEKLFKKTGVRKASVKVHSTQMKLDVKWSEISNDYLVSLLKSLQWDKPGCRINAEIGFLEKKGCPINSWIVLAPQVGKGSAAEEWEVGDEKFRCVARTRGETRFGVFSSPGHVDFAKWLVGEKSDKFDSSELKQAKNRGVLLFYPTREKIDEGKVKKGTPVMGFALVLPDSELGPQRVAFQAKALP